MRTYFLYGFLLALCLSLLSGAAMTQATRTWVSGVGDDVNPCSRTAPCKTLAGAITKTAAGGEISILDPGGFGSVTITKSITIDGGGVIGSILSSGTIGIIVNAPDAVVTIRNFSINGAGLTLGINGIRVTTVKKLYVENCVLANFSDKAIDFAPVLTAELMINGVTIHNAFDGVSIGNGTATISNSLVSGCTTGINANTGTQAYLSGNIISNNGTALLGQGKFLSTGNNSIVANKAQGAGMTAVKMQ